MSAQKQPFAGKIAIITGGSKGIGKATARQIVLSGGSVCIIARQPEALAKAAAELAAAGVQPNQFVETISCDTSDEGQLKPHLEHFVARHGVPDYLLNVVGYAYPEYGENLSIDEYRRNMDVNYFGQIVPTLLLLPQFIGARKGHIANVGSVLSYMAIAGYTNYAPTKYAIFGFTEALRQEMKPYGIRLSILFPPDTDTPGFEQENISKPPAVALLSSRNAKLMTADAVAKVFIKGLLRGDFEILPGDARMLRLASRLVPSLVRRISDREFRRAQRDVAANPET